MTNEELNTKLYEKLFAEQQEYKGWLLTQPPEVILEHAYAYVIRVDIVLAMEYHDVTDEQAKALLAAEKPLESIFQIFENIEGEHMDVIRDCIEKGAERAMEKQAEALRNLPVYAQSAAYAREHQELDVYRTSHRANVACKEAIEGVISEHYQNNRLDAACVQEVVERFGMERTAFILASTVQDKDWDARISPDNKAWAKTVAPQVTANEHGWTKRPEYVCSQTHPGLIDLFLTQFRKVQEREKERKPSVLKKLKEAAADTPAKAPSRKKEVEL